MEPFHIDNMTGRNNSGARPNDPVKNLTASSIIGDKIFNHEGETLGRINDLMIDVNEAKITYVVVAFGGFFGMGRKYFAVPMHALTIAREHRNAFILNETKESLKNYPGFDKEHWPGTNSHAATAAPSITHEFMDSRKENLH